VGDVASEQPTTRATGFNLQKIGWLGAPNWAGTLAPIVERTNLIEARGLAKRYGKTVAVDGLSFDVRPGQVTGFLGPNGSGKSTTMRVIMGLDMPSAGQATINGRAYRGLPWPLHEVGALLEAKAIHPGRSAFNHLWMLAQTNGISRKRVNEVLDLVGLSDVAGRRAGKFSLGMSQRLGIAAALLGDPGVLLFDEPVNGLDPEGILWVRTLLRHLAGEGRTVFVSSHLMSEMALTADHVVVIGRGKLIADRPVSDLVAQSSRRFVTVRSPEPDRLVPLMTSAGGTVTAENDGGLSVTGLTAEAIGDLASEHHIRLHELTPLRASLEEAFMDLTRDSVEFQGHSAGWTADQAPVAGSDLGASDPRVTR
jgi:ABC-2 type transport system ATP-binding protein